MALAVRRAVWSFSPLWSRGAAVDAEELGEPRAGRGHRATGEPGVRGLWCQGASLGLRKLGRADLHRLQRSAPIVGRPHLVREERDARQVAAKMA